MLTGLLAIGHLQADSQNHSTPLLRSIAKCTLSGEELSHRKAGRRPFAASLGGYLQGTFNRYLEAGKYLTGIKTVFCMGNSRPVSSLFGAIRGKRGFSGCWLVVLCWILAYLFQIVCNGVVLEIQLRKYAVRIRVESGWSRS